MQRCFFFFFSQHSAGTALAELREIRGEKIQKIVEFFALVLMCPWCVNECKSKYVYFFSSENITCCNFTKWQWSGIKQMILHTVYHFWPSKLPYVLFKRFQHFHFNPEKLGAFPFFHCSKAEPPAVPFGHVWYHIPPGALHAVCTKAPSWPGCGFPVKHHQGISA